jgi:hypothetical protein
MNRSKFEVVHHYTHLRHAANIVALGAITPSRTWYEQDMAADGHSSSIPQERPIVWLSSDQYMEQTAIKEVIDNGRRRTMSMLEQHKVIGVVRFSIQNRPPVLNAKYLRQLANINRATWDRMLRGAARVGANPLQWFGVIGAVDRSLWTGIEIWSDAWTEKKGWRELVPSDWDRMESMTGVIA